MGEPRFQHECLLRVRYSETDQMGTFYNSRALEWFEVGRTETLRATGVSYAEMEKRGALLPLVEAAVRYEGRARYDDLLRVACAVGFAGKASLRFDMAITHADSAAPVAAGHTLHAITDAAGRPTRAPRWLIDVLQAGKSAP